MIRLRGLILYCHLLRRLLALICGYIITNAGADLHPTPSGFSAWAKAQMSEARNEYIRALFTLQ